MNNRGARELKRFFTHTGLGRDTQHGLDHSACLVATSLVGSASLSTSITPCRRHAASAPLPSPRRADHRATYRAVLPGIRPAE